MTSPSQLAANRENAQASTGPNTPEGKARSSQNAFKNGLASGRLIIPGEDPSEFKALLAALIDEHQPAMPTECILVESLAKHHWLESRAQRLQNDLCGADVFVCDLKSTDFALLLRYETTHHRAFHKSLATLLKLQKDRREAPNGFVSQNSSHSAAPILTPDSCLLTSSRTGFVSQNHPSSPQTGFVSQESSPSTAPAPILTPDSCLLTSSKTGFVSQNHPSSPQTGFVSQESSPSTAPAPPPPSRPTPRNHPCPCRSGKKYKKCCLGKPLAA